MASQGATTSSRFKGEKWWLEAKERDENWHEGGCGHRRQNDIFRFGIARAQRALLCAKRTNSLIFAVYEAKVVARIVGGS